MERKFYYQAEVTHPGLNKYRIVKAVTKYELQMKVNALKAQWDEQWTRKLEQQSKEADRQAKRLEREARIRNEEESQRYALEMTQQAEEAQQAIDRMLLDREKAHELNPNNLKDYSTFPEPRPVLAALQEVRIAPQITDEKYNPKPSFFTKISKKKMNEFTNRNTAEYEKDYNAWKQEKDIIDAENEKAKTEYNEKLLNWEKAQLAFLETQTQTNAEVDKMFIGIQKGEPSAIEKYIELLLGEMEFPFDYSIEAINEYNVDNRGIVIEIYLPTVDDIPKLKSVSYD